MPSSAMQVLLPVVVQHVEEAASLENIRAALVAAPQVRLFQLGRTDERLVAHLDGIAVAGDVGRRLCEEALATPGPGEVFAFALRALEDGDMSRVDRALALAEAEPGSRRGIASAFAWASAQDLRLPIREMLGSTNVFRRIVAIGACVSHRVDPGEALSTAIANDDASLRATGLRAAGESGRVDLLQSCLDSMADPDTACSFHAVRSSILLGDRGASVATLREQAAPMARHRRAALALLLKLVESSDAASVLKALSTEPGGRRLLIAGIGSAGDIRFVPWLIDQMKEASGARLAGEAFSTMTGVDLATQQFEREASDRAAAGSMGESVDMNEDAAEDVANDANGGLEEDEGLPWPDPAKVGAWWTANSHLFNTGGRNFAGAAPSRDRCLQVLRQGCQRQRSASAEHLCLLHPGTVLFPTAAPAWRQRRWLEAMKT